MRLITAHRILIGSAVAFFLFFAGSELRSYAATGTLADFVGALFGIVAAAGLGVYLAVIWRR